MKLSVLLLPLLVSAAVAPAVCNAQRAGPLRLIKTIPLPHITGGDFDHFATDEKGDRLYVVSEVYASIEVFDLKSGNHLQSILGKVKSPRKIVFLADKHALFVADAGTASVKVFDTTTFQQIAEVPLEAGPDAGVYDAAGRTFYVGNGGKAAHHDFSHVTAISVDTYEITEQFKLPSATLKTIVLDAQTRNLYVTMRDTSRIGVIDLKTGSLESVWMDPSLHTDSAMALDMAHHRVFVGNRNPGQLVVLNQATGTPVAKLPIGDTSDGMTYDVKNHRLLIASADGVDVVAQTTPDEYHLMQHVDTFGGKTCIYVPSLHRFYVVHTKGEKAPEAGLQVFEVK